MLKRFAKWLVSDSGEYYVSLTFLITIFTLMLLGFFTPPR